MYGLNLRQSFQILKPEEIDGYMETNNQNEKNLRNMEK